MDRIEPIISGHETALRQAMRLLTEIDDNPVHPANDSRHPEHLACLQAYSDLEQWVTEQQALRAKINKLYGLDDLQELYPIGEL